MDDFLGLLRPTEHVRAADVVVSLLVSFGLASVIALTYRRTHRGALYGQSYVHALVLLTCVTTVVIMVVGDSAARAFAVFGAFAMIRFRQALTDTRDLGFIFFAMVVGMASGAGRYDMAALATAVICGVVFALSSLDLFGPKRASLLLRVRLPEEVDFKAALDGVLAQHAERADVQSVESVPDAPLLEVSYAVRLAQGADVQRLLAAIRERNGNNRVLVIAVPPAQAARRRWS